MFTLCLPLFHELFVSSVFRILGRSDRVLLLLGEAGHLGSVSQPNLTLVDRFLHGRRRGLTNAPNPLNRAGTDPDLLGGVLD